jgi:signal peptidase I
MEKTQKNQVLKILKISLNVFFYIVIILLLVFSIANMRVRRDDDVPNIFNRGFSAVVSDSMEGDKPDSFNKGDLIFLKMLDEDSRQELIVGDIVTFYDLGIRRLNTHRIVEIIEVDNETYIITRGDNTPGNDDPIRIDEAIAVHTSTWSGAGSALEYLRSPVGFALFVILPVFLILIYEGIVLGRNVLSLNKSKLEDKMNLEKEQAKKDLEQEKERMRQELLEELKKEQNKE